MGTIDIEDHTQLQDYLVATGRNPAGSPAHCRTLAGGVSNKTVLVELADGRAWVLKQALRQLRVKEPWHSDPARIQREAEGLRWLARLAPAGSITPLVFEEPSQNLLAMEAVGLPHGQYKSLLLAGSLPREKVLDLARQFGSLLGTVHRSADAVLPEISRAFDDSSFFVSLRIDPYYRFTAATEPASEPFYRELIAATLTRRFTLVHGDFSPKNVLVKNDRLVLLDHEVIHFGDGAFDVGFGLTHLLCKADHVSAREIDYRDAALAFWLAYRDKIAGLTWAATIEDFSIRHALGCLLARARGKSPLEYLSAQRRDRQSAVVLELMRQPPATIPDLIERFLQRMH